MSHDLEYWNKYLAQQQQLQEAAARQVQSLVDQSGVPLAVITQVAKLDLKAVDPAILQEITLKTGLKLEEIAATKPPPSASLFRQRTRAKMV